MTDGFPIGSSGFRWTPVGGASEYELALSASFRNVTPYVNETRYAHRGLIKSQLDVVYIEGSAVDEVEGDFRYEADPFGFLRMLRDAARGATLNYYPELGIPGETYPLRLVGYGDELGLPPDPDFGLLARYNGRFRFMRADGGSLAPLVSGVVFAYEAGDDWSSATFDRNLAATERTILGPTIRLVRSRAIDVLRDSHYALDPTTGLYVRTALLEPGRTNLFQRSEEFDNAYWTKNSSTISANADRAPDSTTTADRLTEDATAAVVHGVMRAVTITADAYVVLSSHFKAGTRGWAYFNIQQSSGASNFIRAWFNLNDGSLGSVTMGGTASLASSYIESIGDGWYRCVIVGKINNGATAIQCSGRVTTGDLVFSYSGSGVDYVRIWGMQVEEGVRVASSYVPTTSAAVTRPADDLRYPWSVGPRSMTFYARIIEAGGIFETNAELFRIGLTDPAFDLLSIGGVYVARHFNGSSNVSAAAASAPALGNLVELRATLKSDGSVALGQSINGGAEAVVTSGALTLASGWSSAFLYVGSLAAASPTLTNLRSLRVARGERTLDQMRQAA